MRTDPQWEHPYGKLAKQPMKMGEMQYREHAPIGWSSKPNLPYNFLAGFPFKTSNASVVEFFSWARDSAHFNSLVPTPLPLADELTINWSMYASPALVVCKPSIGFIGWNVIATYPSGWPLASRATPQHGSLAGFFTMYLTTPRPLGCSASEQHMQQYFAPAPSLYAWVILAAPTESFKVSRSIVKAWTVTVEDESSLLSLFIVSGAGATPEPNIWDVLIEFKVSYSKTILESVWQEAVRRRAVQRNVQNFMLMFSTNFQGFHYLCQRAPANYKPYKPSWSYRYFLPSYLYFVLTCKAPTCVQYLYVF